MKKICLPALMIVGLHCFSQGWTKSYTFPPGNSSSAASMKRGKDAAYYALNQSVDTNNSQAARTYLIKLDTNGVLVWKRILSSSIYSGSGNLNILTDSTIVLTDIYYNGSVQSTGFRRFDKNGFLLDSTTAYPGKYLLMTTEVYNDTLMSMGVDNTMGFSDTVVVEKRTKNLNLVWQRYEYATSINNYDFSACLDSIGNAILLCRQNGFPYDHYTISKYDPAGTLVYSKAVDEAGVPFIMSVTNNHQVYVDENNKINILTAKISGYTGSPLSYVSTYDELNDTTSVTHTFNTNIWQVSRDQNRYFLLNWVLVQGLPWGRIDFLHKTDRTMADLSNFIMISDSVDFYSPQFDKNSLLVAGTWYSGAVQQSRYIKLDTSGSVNPKNLQGTVVNDSNNNCLKDIPDSYLAHNIVYATAAGQTNYTISDPSGNYELSLPNGSYALTAQKPVVAYDNCGVLVGLPISINNDTAVQDIPFYLPPYFDAAVFTGFQSAPRPGVNNVVNIVYDNFGTITSPPCTVKVVLDTLFHTLTSFPPPSIVSGDTLVYYVGTIAAAGWNKIIISGVVDTSVVVGDSLLLRAWIDPLSGDSVPGNNGYARYEYVSASFDPNDKTVNPKGLLTPGYVAKTQVLEYMVRFQNTGNAYAQDVFVLDTLDPHLDLASFRFINTSHSCQVSLIANNILKFMFKNIYLPDSSSNELLSHAYLRYSIQPKTNVNPGDHIRNSASIFFDYNTPVRTNSTMNTVSGLVSIDALPKKYQDVRIYPNPANEIIHILALEKIVCVKVFDLLGNLVIQKFPGQEECMISSYGLNSSVYFIRCQLANGKESLGRIIVSK